MFVDFNILNQLGSPSINSNTFANRPSAGQVGRLFVSTDTFEIYRDNGTGWDLIGGPGSSTVTGSGAAGQVTYWTGTNSVGGENNLWWDAANNRFGVNTNTPTAAAEVVQTDGVALYSNFTTNAGSGAGTTAILAKNTTNGSGYAAVIEERTPNVSAGQYPVLIRHTLSSGTAAANMATGIHFGLPDDAGTERINQFSMDTVDAAAATYSSRYRFLLRNNGSAVTPFYITGTGLGVFTATPGAALDIHSTGVIAQLNSTGATNNGYLAFQRNGTGVWRIGDTYNGGNNYFELHNTVLTSNAIEVTAASNEALFVSAKTYTTGNAIGVAVRHNLTIPNGTNVGLAAIGGVNSNLNLSLGGSTTIANTGRQGLEGSTTISFTGAGTLTMTQGTTLRALSALSTVYAFNGSAVGTITHLAGMRICFPDNPGSAVNITNNYGILINDQTTGTGTVTYTNRWGVYQEGTSDLNYFAGNTLIGTTTNTGDKLNVNGNINISTQTFFRYNGDTGLIGSGTSISGGTANELGIRAANDILFATNGANERMRITSGGLVGIKTTAPSGLLQLNGVLATPGDAANITIKQSGTTYTDGIYLERTGERNGYYMYIGGAVDSLNFRRNYFGTQSDVMSLTRDGNVGINETNATLKLVVSSSSAGVMQLKGTNGGSTNNTQLRFFGSNYNDDLYAIGTEVATGSTNRAFDIYDLIGNASRFRISTAGNVLIGTTTDAGQKLQVNGNASINDRLKINDTVSTNINVNTQTTIYSNIPTYSGIIFSVKIYWQSNGNAEQIHLLFAGAVDTAWGTPNSGLATISSIDWSGGYAGGTATFAITGSGINRNLAVTMSNASTYPVSVLVSLINM